MATSKVTVTLHGDQIEQIRSLVAAGQSPNISAFVQHAVRIALHDATGWAELLEAAMKETGGPLTNKERALADRTLGHSPTRKKSTGRRKAA